MLARDDAAAEQQEEQQQIASPARPLAHPTHPARSLATQRSTDAEPSGCFYLLAKCSLTFLAPKGGSVEAEGQCGVCFPGVPSRNTRRSSSCC